MKNSEYLFGTFVQSLYVKPLKPLLCLFVAGLTVGFASGAILNSEEIYKILDCLLSFLKIYPPVLGLYGILIARKYDIKLLKEKIILDDPGVRNGFVACRIGFLGLGVLIAFFGALVAVLLMIYRG